MQCLKIEVEAPVCSFRMPHFLVGNQLTYSMPPPSTIFGLVASTLGRWPAADEFEFAYRFVAAGRAFDLEHQHIVSISSGKLGATGAPKTIQGSIQPVPREFLFDARLTLYLNRPDWLEPFTCPAFTVVLGRSQDLAYFTSIEVVNLEQSQEFSVEHTLLPSAWRSRTSRGSTTWMPRHIGQGPEREASFASYIELVDWVFQKEGEDGSRQLLRYGKAELLDVDGTVDTVSDLPLGLVWHQFQST